MSSIDGRTAVYGLIRADPTGSWSPAMHRAAFDAQGLNAAYVPLTVDADQLAAAITGAHALGFRGLNVGAPHKQGVARLCAELDPVSTAIGAVNTVVRLAHGWSGYNTDAVAFAELLARCPTAPKSALVFGAGGAARATAWAFQQRGVRAYIAARDADEAAELCALFRDSCCERVPWKDATRVASEVDCIVNAMPCDVEHTRALSTTLRREQIVVDWVYGGISLTPAARRLGCPFIGGDSTLVLQGALANALWTGLLPPYAAMAEAVARAAAA